MDDGLEGLDDDWEQLFEPEPDDVTIFSTENDECDTSAGADFLPFGPALGCDNFCRLLAGPPVDFTFDGAVPYLGG